MNSPIQLVVIHGMLATPPSAIVDALQKEWSDGQAAVLLRRYDAGDVDSIPWPWLATRTDLENLSCALYDAREMGLIPDNPIVLLPDGTPFNIDRHVI